MIAAIHYKVNESGQFIYLSSGVNEGDEKSFLKKVEDWNATHEDKYRTFDDPLVVLLAMRLQEVRQKNDEGRLADAIDDVKETIDEMMDDLDALSSRMSEVKAFLESQKEAGG